MGEPLKKSACETPEGYPMADPKGPDRGGPLRARADGGWRGPLATVAMFLVAVAAALGIVALLLEFGILWLLLLLFAGVLLGVMLRGLAMGVHRRTGLSEGKALGLVVVLIIGGLVGLVWWSAPRLAEQANQMAKEIPKAIEQLKGSLSQYPWAQGVVAQAPSVQEMAGGPDLIRKMTGIAGRTLNGIVYAVVVLIIGIYLASAPEENLQGVVLLFPCRRRHRVREVLLEAGETLRLWMIGQLIPMVVIGLLVGTGLWLLKIPMAWTLGLLAALFNFIPNFGQLISMVPAALLALSQGPEKALYVVGLCLAAQSIEGYLVTPLVQQRMVQLAPALTIASQVVLGILVGGIGVALAAPLTAALLVLVKMLYVEDVLGEETELPSEQHEKAKEGNDGG